MDENGCQSVKRHTACVGFFRINSTYQCHQILKLETALICKCLDSKRPNGTWEAINQLAQELASQHRLVPPLFLKGYFPVSYSGRLYLCSLAGSASAPSFPSARRKPWKPVIDPAWANWSTSSAAFSNSGDLWQLLMNDSNVDMAWVVRAFYLNNIWVKYCSML